ncbi:MAG: prephenate dehydratase [Caldilineaceae bacterium]|uniref:Prephenate dehydratase n=1 Tax=Caldilineaceae bacterium SB0675_bin_29 TaxID=2605266 RepID=A0A6B1G3K1_9CHLR|nr:prephenate dehydratase [Caldilineaceae bacterium]MYH63509.1 prephenate dehydratase [Caldilineaceae bacterium SB0675_bin_29]
MTVVAFQGEHGAYSEEAIRQQFGAEVDTLPIRTFEDIFASLDDDRSTVGVVPVENSLAGSINKAYDLLLDHDFRVQGEILLRVRHNLLTLPGNGDNIEQVRSHPQALAQCESFLNRHGYTAIPWYDTAGSAKELAEHPEPKVGVIASALAAEIYDLEIVQQGIEDLHFNFTRFFVIGKGDAQQSPNSKTSLVFATPHSPGALYACLGEFAERNINLVKLESRPRRNRPWQYVFYLDFEGHWQESDCSAAVLGLLNRAAFVKMLGSYPAAVQPAPEEYAQEAMLQV